VAARTACINRIRGLLSEFGIVLPLKAEVVRCEARNHLEALPGYANLVIATCSVKSTTWTTHQAVRRHVRRWPRNAPPRSS